MFVNLHVHSEYSLLDGACRIKNMVSRAVEMGQTALAVTDHGNMFAAIDFYNECKARGIKAIIGCEVYVAPRSRFDRVSGIDNRPYHLILLCKNGTGYKNLIKMVSLSYSEGFYVKPRTDIELLRKYSEGLVCLSGCIAGEVPQLILSGNMRQAAEKAREYRDIFGEGNYFLEVQNHMLPEDGRLLPALFRLSAETGIPLAATNDTHYVKREDASAQRILLAIQTGSYVSDNIPIAFPNDEFYLKSEEEMLRLFQSHSDAVYNTGHIADMCTFEPEFGNIKLPRYDPTEEQMKRCGGDNALLLRLLCKEGLERRYGANPPDSVKQRLEYELKVIIEQTGYTDYFLIVWDFIAYAKSKGIPVGPGRGSGAGSVAAYCIGITDIDPIKYNLLFERFLNPERVSMPDFDIDFCYERRGEVIEYVTRRYGNDRVAQIVTFGTMAAKAAVRDVTRVLKLPYSAGDEISRLIPSAPHITLDEALSHSAELSRLYENDAQVRRIIDTAKKLEGMPRNTSTHAAGVVICDAPVSDYVPIIVRDGVSATQYTMTGLEKVGLLKMDFLGLRNLTVIDKCEKAIRKVKPDFSAENIPYDDKATFEMLSSGDTSGVFQFESEGMTALLVKLRPQSVEDLTAALSLYRPGPMDSIPRYLENRAHPDKITYAHPILKEILDVTYGCIVYQEQVMEICRKMAGYSYGQADIVRRNMAKKKHAEMEKERGVFVKGAEERGVPAATANGIFDEMAGFASYAFNKSHAAAYSVLAFRTAYLKCHYYKEYMAALMTVFTEYTGKLMEYISQCGKRGVRILRPDINESGMGFTATEKGIRFSLLAAKGMGDNVIKSIVEERERNGAYRNLTDVIKRLWGKELGCRSLESLIKCGALDGLGLNRRQMMENYETIADSVTEFSKGAIEGQLDFFGMAEDSPDSDNTEKKIPPVPEFGRDELLEMEKEILGIYISGHPLEQARFAAQAAHLPDTAALADMREGVRTGLVCCIDKVRQHTAKNGTMAFVQISDMAGEAEAVVFSEAYMTASSLLTVGKRVYMEGKISSSRSGERNILANRIIPAESFCETVYRSSVLYIRCRSDDKTHLRRIAKILGEHSGGNPVFFRPEDSGKTIAHKEIKTCRISGELIDLLNEAAGKENVAIVFKGKI